jgi:hypothetical protein
MPSDARICVRLDGRSLSVSESNPRMSSLWWRMPKAPVFTKGAEVDAMDFIQRYVPGAEHWVLFLPTGATGWL